jgi:hypothetical protein
MALSRTTSSPACNSTTRAISSAPADLGSTAHGTLLTNPNTYVGTPASNAITVNWANAGTQTMNLNLGTPNNTNGLTGYGSADSAQMISQDGNPSGTLQSLSVNSNGNLIGLYSNGKSLPLYQLQIATFSNPAGLTNAGGNLWQSVDQLRSPDPAPAGHRRRRHTGRRFALEGSNVDIATQFTEMITAQRGYQVNARVIQTEDGLLRRADHPQHSGAVRVVADASRGMRPWPASVPLHVGDGAAGAHASPFIQMWPMGRMAAGRVRTPECRLQRWYAGRTWRFTARARSARLVW